MALFLVVDDSHFAHHLASAVITANGHEMISAYGGKQCLEMVAEQKPDCVLMDFHMPDSDGIEVLDQLMDKIPTLPVIMLTADIQKTSEKEYLEHGARGVLNKPLDGDEFIEMIGTVLGANKDS